MTCEFCGSKDHHGDWRIYPDAKPSPSPKFACTECYSFIITAGIAELRSYQRIKTQIEEHYEREETNA